MKRYSTKSRGGFFAKEKTFPYLSAKGVIGQLTDDSCVAAVCRMLLIESGVEIPEAFLRVRLNVQNDGSNLSAVVDILSEETGILYEFRSNLTFEELKRALLFGSVAVNVRAEHNNIHALLIEKIADNFVYIRDSIPLGQGSMYKISQDVFLRHWFSVDEKGVGIVLK
jgi:ABC-type bacteriocin/lantibiotic exporter with double-glycine peptidase domain